MEQEKRIINKLLRKVLSDLPKEQLQKLADMQMAIDVYDIYVKRQLDAQQSNLLALASSVNSALEMVRIASTMKGEADAMERLRQMPTIAAELLKGKLDNKSN